MANIKTVTQKLEAMIAKKYKKTQDQSVSPIAYLLSPVSYYKNQMLSKSIVIFLLIIAGTFLTANIIMSQIISPLLSKLVNNDKQAMIEYLIQIRFGPFFGQELQTAILTYGNQIKNDVFSAEIQRNQKIKQFEQILEYNPDSRDTLFSLYQLYLQSNNKQKASEYLSRAKTVDPEIK